MGIVGAGSMAQGLANQIVNSVPGVVLAAVGGRRLERAEHVVRYAEGEPVAVDTVETLDAAVACGATAITTDPMLLVHFEVPGAIAWVRNFRDELAPPLAGPVAEVCAVAKRDLKAGETLDEYGR